MSDEVLARMVELIQGRENVGSTTYIWHGAEPLAVGKRFFESVRREQSRFDHRVRNGMQSSGVLLTPSFADVLVANEINLGLSLDGPNELHNQMRPFRTGGGSFDQVMRSIDLMRERGKKPGVIAVLTKMSLPYLDDMYDFFKSTGLNFKISPILDCGFAEDKGTDLQLTLDERVQAITHLFDRWFFDEQDGHIIDYENMRTLTRAIFTKGGGSCDMMHNCQDAFISVEVNGDVYPCSRFGDFSYGNIFDVDSFEDILAYPLRQQVLGRFDGIPECVACEYNFLCYSGCMHNAYLVGDIMDKDPNCDANRRIYDHISERVLAELERDGAIGG